MDDDKSENPYGDAIIWLEMLRSAHSHLIFVTKDRKEDWWLNICGKQSPRPELIREMLECGKVFHMYTLDAFIKRAFSSLPTEEQPTEELINDAVNEAKAPPEKEGTSFLPEESSHPTMMGFFGPPGQSPFLRKKFLRQSGDSWRSIVEQCIVRLTSVIRHVAAESGLDDASWSNPLDILSLLSMGSLIPDELANEISERFGFMMTRLNANLPIPPEELNNLVGWTDYACGRLRLTMML